MAAGMRELQCCRTCLTTDARLYNLEQYGLSKSYTSLLGYACDEDDGLPCTVCYECASRLDKFRIFRKRSRRAHAVLRGLLEENGEITSNHVRKINRTQCDLTSSLMCCNLRPIHIESKDHTLNFVQINSKSNNLEVNTTEAEIKPVGFELKWEVNSPETAVDNAHDYENLPEMKRERGSLKTEKIVPSQNKSEPKRGSTAPKSQKKVHIREKKALKRKNVTKGEENCLKSETAGEEGAKKKKRVSALTVKIENGGGNEAIDKVVAGKKKTRRGARPGARQHTMYSAEYYNNFATVTVMTEEEDQMECFNQRQYSERYKNALHSCSDCYRVFVNESAYEEHRKRHDDPSEGDEVCNICKVRRKNARALQKHIAMNHRNKFECRKCTHVCTTSLGAREHEAMHSDKKAFQCTECDLAFNRLSAYHQHTYRLHRMLAACPECGATYLDQGAVNTHRANTHGEEVDADCKKKCECGALFYSDDACSVHKSSHPKHAHGGTGTIHCEFCEAKFPGIKATQEHRKTHKEASAVFSQRLHPSMQELEDFECEQCGEVLSTNREYYHHFRHSHPDRVRTKYPQHCRNPGNSVMCELCGRGFQNLTSYRTHIRIDHQGEKPHKCDICNKSFKLSTSLSEHRRVHTKERPYKCSVCNKAFRHIANYQRHKSVHIDERPFGCEICEKYFKWRYALKAHIQYVHLKKPWPKRERGKCNKNTSKTESVDALME